jgi:hypothetical protein
MNTVFEKDLKYSTPITREDWANRGVEDRAKEAAARVWARLL